MISGIHHRSHSCQSLIAFESPRSLFLDQPSAYGLRHFPYNSHCGQTPGLFILECAALVNFKQLTLTLSDHWYNSTSNALLYRDLICIPFKRYASSSAYVLDPISRTIRLSQGWGRSLEYWRHLPRGRNNKKRILSRVVVTSIYRTIFLTPL